MAAEKKERQKERAKRTKGTVRLFERARAMQAKSVGSNPHDAARRSLVDIFVLERNLFICTSKKTGR
jgi:hypothetical protein